MTDVIVVVNAGSSSLKFGLYAAGSDTTEPLVTGKVTGNRWSPARSRVSGGGRFWMPASKATALPRPHR